MRSEWVRSSPVFLRLYHKRIGEKWAPDMDCRHSSYNPNCSKFACYRHIKGRGFSQLFRLNNPRQIHVLRHTPGQAMSCFTIVMDNCEYDQPRSYPPFTLHNSCTKLLKFSAFSPYALLGRLAQGTHAIDTSLSHPSTSPALPPAL